jgi:hypothetical protein
LLLLASPGKWSRFSWSSNPKPLSSKASWLSNPGQFSKSSLRKLDASLALRMSRGVHVEGDGLLRPFWMVGDDASVSSRTGACLAAAPAASMVRSVEREDWDDSGGDFVSCDARRRLPACGTEANLT